MYQAWYKNLSLIVKFLFISSWCPANKLDWYKVIILLAHDSGICSNDFSFLGVVISLNSNESNNEYFSANVSNFCIADLV